MRPTLLALGAAPTYAVRIDDRLGRRPCLTTCTTCSTTPRRAENGETTP
ncbi:hypothetical protein R6L23_20030 [Streptomyces sp. SR27]|nr:hypothetical protein [Streptomyces sp. SR27]MDV9190477.1 hypothetical protein [Streptomyces sp. SR27]